MTFEDDFLVHFTTDKTPEILAQDLLNSLLTMAWMVEARDPYTGGHLWRVSQMSRILAKAAGLSARQTEKIAIGGFLHDLGKIAVPDNILTKNSRLTDAEYAIIKTHPDVGWRLLAGHPFAELAQHAVRSHHETPNGKGYPQGLSAENIPLEAKIVGLCDAFDAMTSTRPYRRGMPVDRALSIIAEGLGQQFDSLLGELFIKLGHEDKFVHIVAHSDDGIPLQECGVCGPIVVIQRHQAIGEHVYCQSCHGEYEIKQDAQGNKQAITTGKFGSANDLITVPDLDVISDLVKKAVSLTEQ